jgi:hypothetical protein
MKLIKKEVKQNFTVDCEVEDTHCYQLDNGIISHNTLSLLGGATPGGHPAYAQYYIRRVEMSSTDKLVAICKELGYSSEYKLELDGTSSRDTVKVSFPCFAGDNLILAKDISAVKQLELNKKLQHIWSDNSVSVTIYYKIEELPEIKKWMKENYEGGLKTVSFLLHAGHGFKQAPYEEITKERYLELMKDVKPIGSKLEISGENFNVECDGGACPIK